MYDVIDDTVKKPQFSSDVTNLCCESCVIVKDQLLQVSQELKSARTIITLLQEDIIKLNAAASSNESKPSQHRESNTHDQVNRNWIPVLHNGSKKFNKPVVPATKLNRLLITLSNRFTPLSGVQESKVPSETITFNEVEHNKGRGIHNKKLSNIGRSKIIILGDSHARGCSQEVIHNLDHNVEVQGIVKPGANIETIVNTSTKDIEKLTKKDIVVVCGGTRYVGKNESVKGLHQLKNFVVNHSQTNFIVMCVPYRHDLDLNSCINDKVKVYNRKLKKYLKVCENTQIIEIDSSRELFTKHGLHLNLKGKDQIAKEDSTDN